MHTAFRASTPQRDMRTQAEISLSTLRTSTGEPSLILICPARTHNSTSKFTSNFPTFSVDHILTVLQDRE